MRYAAVLCFRVARLALATCLQRTPSVFHLCVAFLSPAISSHLSFAAVLFSRLCVSLFSTFSTAMSPCLSFATHSLLFPLWDDSLWHFLFFEVVVKFFSATLSAFGTWCDWLILGGSSSVHVPWNCIDVWSLSCYSRWQKSRPLFSNSRCVTVQLLSQWPWPRNNFQFSMTLPTLFRHIHCILLYINSFRVEMITIYIYNYIHIYIYMLA